MEKLKTCPNCNKEYSITNKFCSNCGAENINSNEKESTKKMGKNQLKLIGGIIVCLTIIISIGLLYAENNQFSIITGTWIEEKEKEEGEDGEFQLSLAQPEIIIPEDGTMTMTEEIYETLAVSLNYELESMGKNTYRTTDVTSIQVSFEEDLVPDDMIEFVSDVIFEDVSPIEEKKGFTITYKMEFDNLESKNNYLNMIANKVHTIDYLGNDLMELTTSNSDSPDNDNFSPTLRFHREYLTVE